MKCERCHEKEATFFYEETINGQKRTLRLCADCAKDAPEAGMLGGTHASPFSFLSGDGFFDSLLGLPQHRVTSGRLCPDCGAPMRDISATGRVGCPRCYEIFKSELEGSVRSIHGSAVHTGRAPASQGAHREKQSKLTELKEKLRTAIADERFEEAAALRDEIQALEKNEKEGA